MSTLPLNISETNGKLIGKPARATINAVDRSSVRSGLAEERMLLTECRSVGTGVCGDRAEIQAVPLLRSRRYDVHWHAFYVSEFGVRRYLNCDSKFSLSATAAKSGRGHV